MRHAIAKEHILGFEADLYWKDTGEFLFVAVIASRTYAICAWTFPDLRRLFDVIVEDPRCENLANIRETFESMLDDGQWFVDRFEWKKT